MLADVLGPASACTYGVVKERKVALTGLAIRTRCRFFRIAGLLPLFFACFADSFARSTVRSSQRRVHNDLARTQRGAYPERDGESLPESCDNGLAVTAQQSIEGQLN